MMNRIRGLVYWLGFRPKYPSIFYSPSRHYIELGKIAVAEVIKSIKKNNPS